MIRYVPENQLSIEEFETPFKTLLSADNRWVKLSEIVPWDKFASIYISIMNSGFGRPGISPRVVLGAMIIKHMEKLDDRGVIAAIGENVYMQYFVGLSSFSTKPVFDPSLFVEIRKRVGKDVFDTLSIDLIQSLSGDKDKRHNQKSQIASGDEPVNKGKMQADATVADQYITHPRDNITLNAARKKTEDMIDLLYVLNNKKGTKPRTYRRVLNTDFLNYSKKKKKSKAEHRKMTHKLLEAVQRNFNHIDKQLDALQESNDTLRFPLGRKQQHMLWVLKSMYTQQREMYVNRTRSCSDRIVSIYQPHVRPIPRGKAKAQTEFGSKLGVSLDQGFALIYTFSWDAYNEGEDLTHQVESYKIIHGHYPGLVQVDKIYATRANRRWLKLRGIRITASPLGRKSTKNVETNYQKRKRKKEAAERNHIEGKFGQGKSGYELNKIRARLKATSESWVACIFFIMNLINYQKKSFLDTISKAYQLLLAYTFSFHGQMQKTCSISFDERL